MSNLCERCNGFTSLPPQYVLDEMARHGQSPFMCPGHANEPPSKPDQRDIQFAGFANLLLTELRPDLALLFTELASRRDINSAENIIKQHIARRAYDLVEHVIEDQLDYGNIEQGTLENIMDRIPDMTVWPEEQAK